MDSTFSFKDAIEYVKSLDTFGSVLGLDTIRSLADELDNPQDGLKFIHVTGTNGKGSVSSFISQILKYAGLKVGTYNSPAVLSNIDQYKINNKIISKSLYAEAVSIVKPACFSVACKTGNHPTRFEVETMVAFVAFYLEKCDIVVLETGLGGVLDATNIVSNTLLHVFTKISMDHVGMIGNTIEEIAANKAGIIKSSAPTVLFRNDNEVDITLETEPDVLSDLDKESSKDETGPEDIIINRCKEMESDVYEVSKKLISNIRIKNSKLLFDIEKNDCLSLVGPLKDIKLKMLGMYQPINALIAITAINVLIEIGYNITEDNIRRGLKKTKIPFRFEHLTCKKADIILDGAHNADGAEWFIKSLSLNYPDRDFIFVTGIFKDKDYENMARLTASHALKVYVIQNMKSVRSLDKDVLGKTFSEYNSNVVVSDSIKAAVRDAVFEANNTIFANAKNPVVCCFGSLSWLKDAKKQIKKLKKTYKKYILLS